MRDKFSELIDAGVAQFTYKPTAPETSEPGICREYNNLFALPTDTHMCEIDGTLYITGSALNGDWFGIMGGYARGFSAIDFRHAGYCSISDFLFKHQLCAGDMTILNGDKAQIIRPYTPGEIKQLEPIAARVGESAIPVPLHLLGDPNVIRESFKDKDPYEICEALNSSSYVRGRNWVWAGAQFVCPADRTVYVIETNK